MAEARIRTVIVDDEPLARRRIRRLLQADPGVEIVAECGAVREASEALRRLAPDLVFLDIQMPDGDGFAVLDQLNGTPAPVVVFVTAFDHFALRAFEVHAQDYLLKPFDRQRFQKALSQAKEQVAQRQSAASSRRLAELLETWKESKRYLTRLVVKSSGRITFLKTADVDWIEAADNYIRLHTAGESHLLRETMNAIESRLDPAKFSRIHRSTIVNLDRIEQLEPWFRGDYIVRLRGGTQLTLSRGYRDRLQKAVGRAF